MYLVYNSFQTAWIIIVLYQLPVIPSSLVYSWQTDTSATSSAPVYNRRLDAQPIYVSETAVEVMTQCLMKCNQELECQSINFLPGRVCELLPVTEKDNGFLYSVAEGYIHITATNMKLEPLYQSYEISCNGHGIPYSTGNSELGQSKCVCDYGWLGSHCQIQALGHWSVWQDWSSCSVTCGKGWKKRQRVCDGNNIKPDTNVICSGTSLEYSECESSCPEWSEWGIWEDCMVGIQCGVGNKIRRRTCLGKEDVCPGFSHESMPCDVLSCEAPCKTVMTTDDQFGSGLLYIHNGTSWLPVCSNGFTDYAGSLACREMGFSGFHQALNSGKSVPSDWGIRFSCKDTERLLTECQHKVTKREANCSRVTHLFCVVDGHFEDWSPWGECSVSCGGGNQTRNRSCVGTAYGGKTCEGHYNETQECGQEPCAIDCIWYSWSEWGDCNVTCGGGIKQRYRNSSGPFYGGKSCDGYPTSSDICSTNPCPIDCEWNSWSQWGACNVTCGGGLKQRYRNTSGPFYGGKPCDGNSVDFDNCSTDPCPIDGIWEVWSNWSSCSTSCGPGLSLRNRTCTGPFFDGIECEGADSEQRNCSLKDCAVHGQWTEWTTWTLCSVTCKGGTRSRSRTCQASENPAGLEVVCGEGSDFENEACHEFDCEPFAKNCEEWKTKGLVDSVSVQIKPDYEAFWVRCNLTGMDGFVITEFTHKNMNRTRVDGFEAQGGFILNLEYTTTIPNINSFIDRSAACRQYISWECHAAAIKNPLSATGANTYWSDRFKDPKYYWGGADHNGDNCACGDTNECSKPNTKCNCDANDDQLRQDAGYLTYKQDLPITEFLAGDTGDKTQYYTIGPIECWGEDADYADYGY